MPRCIIENDLNLQGLEGFGTVLVEIDKTCNTSRSELTEIAGIELSLAPKKQSALVTEVTRVEWVRSYFSSSTSPHDANSSFFVVCECKSLGKTKR